MENKVEALRGGDLLGSACVELSKAGLSRKQV